VLVLAAAVLIAAVPFAARPFLGFSVDAFDTVSIGGFAGSLFGVLVLVAVPVTQLRAAAPLAVGEAASSGEVVGRLYAIFTAGLNRRPCPGRVARRLLPAGICE
jgi:hypothetical protein